VYFCQVPLPVDGSALADQDKVAVMQQAKPAFQTLFK
jgi:hypothetical protein